MNKSKPDLRFPGFEGSWDEKTLGDFMTFKNGVNADKASYGSGRKFINVLDIIDLEPITHERIIGSVEITDKEYEKNEVRLGDVLFQRSSETREEVGQSNIYLDPKRTATFGGFVIRGRPTVEFNPRFFDALLKTDAARKDMTSRSGGSTRYNIGQESIAAVKVHVPANQLEQDKIADALEAVSQKSALLNRQRSALQDYKHGLMQRLFSQDLRFTREDGSRYPDWIPCPFGEIAERLVSPFDPRKEDNNPPLVELDNIEAGSGRLIEFSDIEDQISIKSRFGPGDVLFGKLRPYLRKFAKPEFAGVCSSEIWVIRGIRVSVDFLFYLIQSERFIQRAVVSSSGSKMPRADWQAVADTIFDIPGGEEQKRIAEFLISVDAKIDGVSAQIAHMETFKKGLLQKLFV